MNGKEPATILASNGRAKRDADLVKKAAFSGAGEMAESGRHSALTPQKRVQWRRKLLERARRTLFALQREVDASRGRAGFHSSDECDAAAANSDVELGYAVAQIRAASLVQIQSALNRLEEGTFGQCSSCGGWIKGARLRRMPFASLCLKCQENQERQEAAETAHSAVSWGTTRQDPEGYAGFEKTGRGR